MPSAKTPPEAGTRVVHSPTDCTWKDNSATIVLVPELEQWLWFCANAVAAHCGITVQQLDAWVDAQALKQGLAADILKAEQPKELFEYIMRERLGRTISPRDFEKIGARAGVNGLRQCSSFRTVSETLQAWFPASQEPLP